MTGIRYISGLYVAVVVFALAVPPSANAQISSGLNSNASRAASGDTLDDFVARRTDPNGTMSPAARDAMISGRLAAVEQRRNGLSRAEKLRAFHRYHNLGKTIWPPAITQDEAARHWVDGTYAHIMPKILRHEYGLDVTGRRIPGFTGNTSNSSDFAAGSTQRITDVDIGKLHMHNPRTGETINIQYRNEQGYDKEALVKLNHFWRDWRQDMTHPINPQLFDLLSAVQTKAGGRVLTLTSGYRTRATNTQVGGATESQHVEGTAADVVVPGLSPKQMAELVASFGVGGVGYYPQGGYVHADTGPVRRWTHPKNAGGS